MSNPLSKIFTLAGADGMMHIIVCAAAVGLLKHIMPLWISMFTVLMIGIGKEIYDKVSKKGTCEWKDIICDIVGIAIGAL